MKNRAIKTIKALFKSILVGWILFSPIGIVAGFLFPSIDVEGHVVMPIGQIISSIFICTIIGLVFFTFQAYRIYNNK